MNALRRILRCSLAAFLTTISLSGQQTAVIGTWNLAGNNLANGLSQPIIEEQARGISLFEPDLLVLTEVHPHAAIEDLAATLSSSFSLPYDFVIIDQEQTNLDIGILFKQEVEIGEVGLVEGSDLGEELRKAFFADVRIGEFDFRVIGVHFKSSGGNANINKRRDQARVVADFVTASTAGVEKDILLIGDYNMFPARDRNVFPILSANNFLRFVSSESFCDPPDLDPCMATHIQGSGGQASDGNLLDGFAISTQHTSEIQGDVQRVELPTLMNLPLASFRTAVADHYPIVATFRIDADDDAGGASGSSVKITRLLPNPPGNDVLNEEISIKNLGTSDVQLIDWTVRDLAGRTWMLDELGTLQPQEEKTIVRHGQEMALNNDGDEVDLVDPTGAVVDRVQYPAVTSGQEIHH